MITDLFCTLSIDASRARFFLSGKTVAGALIILKAFIRPFRSGPFITYIACGQDSCWTVATLG